MGKRYGEAYDPEIRLSEHGSRLYGLWKKARRFPHCEEWDYYPTFYLWAIEAGYVLGARLRLIDDSGIYCPENCKWFVPELEEFDPAAFAEKWDKTVNKIRKHYGMPPLEGTEYGSY